MADSDAGPHSLSETAVHGVLRQPELLERIAYYALTLPGPPCPPSPSEPLLGPPTGLTAVLLVSHTWHAALAFHANPRFYARLFGFKFDTAAPRRRLSARWRTSACLAAEFRKRIEVLKRVRYMQLQPERLGDTDDLWTCYVMMLENDGKNERQLADYARLPAYLVACALFRGGPSRAPVLWVTEPDRTSLVVWLWWLMSTRAVLRAEPEPLRLRLEDRVFHVLVATAFRFPSIHRPLGAWWPPSSSSSSPSPSPAPARGCTGPAPGLATITHFAHPLTLSFPPLAPAALLAWAGRTETELDLAAHTLEARTEHYPGTAEEARARRRAPGAGEDADAGEGEDGAPLPTRDAVRAFQRLRMDVPERVPWGRVPGLDGGFDEVGERVLVGERPEAESEGEAGADEAGFQEEERESARDPGRRRAERSSSNSKALDAAWHRLVSPGTTGEQANAALEGVKYELGAVVGRWRGRLVHTAFDVHMRLVMEPRVLAHVPEQLYAAPAGWVLREHHCMPWETPLDVGLCASASAPGEYEDDFLHAWIPEGYRAVERGDHVEVVDEEGRIVSQYETYYPHGPKGPRYAEPVLRKLEGSGVADEWADSAAAAGGGQAGQGQEEEEYEDFVEGRDSGVRDILVTGYTDEEWGDAWGHYSLFGRIRPTDGLVVLHRTPRETQRALGRWTFYGYVHGGNLVGRWRETATAPHLVGFEGGFVVTKQ